jgi:hypothetical protein
MHKKLGHGFLTLSLVSAGLVAVLIAAGGSGGSSPPAVVAFEDLNPATKGLVRSAARRSGVSESGVSEVAGTGLGNSRSSAMVAKSPSGETVIALSQGFGMRLFEPEARLFKRDPMIIAIGTQGPSTEVRQVGVVGGVRPDVDYVVIELADGATVDVDLVAAPHGSARFLSWVGNSPSAFPTAVRAYGASGSVVAGHKIETRPLCPPDDPGCLADN